MRQRTPRSKTFRHEATIDSTSAQLVGQEAPTRRWFRIDAGDGNRYVLRHDEEIGVGKLPADASPALPELAAATVRTFMLEDTCALMMAIRPSSVGRLLQSRGSANEVAVIRGCRVLTKSSGSQQVRLRIGWTYYHPAVCCIAPVPRARNFHPFAAWRRRALP